MTYILQLIDVTDNGAFVKSEIKPFSVDLRAYPRKGELFIHNDKIYAVMDVLYKENADTTLTIIDVTEGVPEWYNEL